MNSFLSGPENCLVVGKTICLSHAERPKHGIIESPIPFGFATCCKMQRSYNEDGFLFSTQMKNKKIIRFLFV